MSRQAIAAALAREDLSCGERLVAFSLASFADRENRARPGTPAAAGRAGLARSQFLEARGRLVGRGLVVVEDAATGRGRASTITLPFAQAGPWWEGELNAELFETVLGYSPTRGPARLLLAVMAALSDEQGVVEGVRTERLCTAAGVADRTYRRARKILLASGEVVLRSGSGGRGNTNRWEIPDPRAHHGASEPPRGRRVPPPAGARPLIATVVVPAAGGQQGVEAVPAGVVRGARGHGVGAGKGGQDRTVSTRNGPVLTGVSALKGCQGRTVSLKTPAKTPARTPAPNARAGREPQNPRTVHPPSPPEEGSGADRLLVEETYLTERGRTRRRPVAVDLGAVRERLRAAGEEDLTAWQRVRALLRDGVGESNFEIWLERLELIAVDPDGTLVVVAPSETAGWVARRFGHVLDRAAQRVGRRLRVADEVERRAAEPLATAAGVAPAGASADGRSPRGAGSADSATEVLSARSGAAPPDGSDASLADQSAPSPTHRSASPSSYTDVYTQTREVS
jgi:DnaA N-terminal domain